MKRPLVALACTAVASLTFVSVAEAAPAGRLSGAYDVRQSVVSSTSGDPDAIYYGDYTFKPSCTSGVCATKLSYVIDDSGETVNVTLRPKGTAYVGSGTHIRPCLDERGTSTLEENAYVATEKYILNTSRVVRGTARAFTGTWELKEVLTAAGREAGCKPRGTRIFALSGTHA